MEFIGKELGTLALISFAGCILNFFVKWYHKRWKSIFSKYKDDNNFIKFDSLLLKVFVRGHKTWGKIAASFVLLHATLQLFQYGFVWSGFLTATFMFLQVSLCVRIIESKNKKFLQFHRYISAFLVIFLLTHLIHTEYFM